MFFHWGRYCLLYLHEKVFDAGEEAIQSFPFTRIQGPINSDIPCEWLSVTFSSQFLKHEARREEVEDTEEANVFGGHDVIALATHGCGGLQRWAKDGKRGCMKMYRYYLVALLNGINGQYRG